jgi:hypothetical protein
MIRKTPPAPAFRAKQREELVDDEKFVQSILEQRGIDPEAKAGDRRATSSRVNLVVCRTAD